jgi:hypothetical protein
MTLLPKLRVSIGFPVGPAFCLWVLDLKQFSFHLVSQPLRYPLGYTNFTSVRFIDMLCSRSGFPLR